MPLNRFIVLAVCGNRDTASCVGQRVSRIPNLGTHSQKKERKELKLGPLGGASGAVTLRVEIQRARGNRDRGCGLDLMARKLPWNDRGGTQIADCTGPLTAGFEVSACGFSRTEGSSVHPQRALPGDSPDIHLIP